LKRAAFGRRIRLHEARSEADFCCKAAKFPPLCVFVFNADHRFPRMSIAVYTANVLTSARMAAGMTSRARRPRYRLSAG
jgi:hypothetical protein